MKREKTYDELLRRLDDAVGLHQRIAKETGVAQATVSRIFLRKSIPRVNHADAILEWFDAHDRKERRSRASAARVHDKAVLPRRGRAPLPASTRLAK